VRGGVASESGSTLMQEVKDGKSTLMFIYFKTHDGSFLLQDKCANNNNLKPKVPVTRKRSAVFVYLLTLDSII